MDVGSEAVGIKEHRGRRTARARQLRRRKLREAAGIVALEIGNPQVSIRIEGKSLGKIETQGDPVQRNYRGRCDYNRRCRSAAHGQIGGGKLQQFASRICEPEITGSIEGNCARGAETRRRKDDVGIDLGRMTWRGRESSGLVRKDFLVLVLDNPKICAGVKNDTSRTLKGGRGYRGIGSYSAANGELRRTVAHQVRDRPVGYPQIAGGIKLRAPRAAKNR